MLRKKPSPHLPAPTQRELKILYERRRVVDSLIRSLEQYDRHRVKLLDFRKEKSA